MRTCFVLLLLLPLAALSDGKRGDPHDDSISNAAAQSDAHAGAEAVADAVADSTVGDIVAGGGGAANNSISERNVAVGLAMHPPQTPNAVDCWFPKTKLGRGQRWLFGMVELSGVLERSEECIDDVQAQHDRQIELLEAQTRLEQARVERIDAEHKTIEERSK